MDKKLILQKAINKYGMTKQLDMLQEECGELISAINHYKRRREKSFIDMLEEIVDVEIMLAQLKEDVLYGADIYQYRSIQRKKWKRLKERVGI